MMDRCYNPASRSYRDYGARGIAVCGRWHDVRLFIADIEASIGPRAPGMTLDRMDSDGPYAPGKVRWATRTQQNRNSRRYVDGTRNDALYRIWWRIMKAPAQVHPDWHDLAAFRAGAGPKPEGRRLVRIDASQPWGPKNARWITGAQQIRSAQAARWPSHQIDPISESRPVVRNG